MPIATKGRIVEVKTICTAEEIIEVQSPDQCNQPLLSQNENDEESEQAIVMKPSSEVKKVKASGVVITKDQVKIFDYEENISQFHMQMLSAPNRPLELKVWRRTTKCVSFTIELNSDNKVVEPTCCDRYCLALRNPRHPCEVKVVFNTRNLRRARDWGLEIIHGLIFPLFSAYGSEIVSLIFFLSAVISCILSSYTFAHEAKHGRYPTLEVVQFALSLAFLFLMTIDLVYSIRSCLLGKALFRRIGKCCNRTQPHRIQGTRTNRSQRCCRWCIAPDTEDNPGRINSSTKEQTRAEKFKMFFTKYVLDIIRVIIVEALVYPSVICDVIDNASSRTYEGTSMQRFKFGRLIFSAAKIIFLVYIIRLFVIVSTISSLEQIRRGDVECEVTEKNGKQKVKRKTRSICNFTMFDKNDGSKKGARKGLVLEIIFLIHIVGQMFCQGLMIGVIWLKIVCENPKPTPQYVVFISPFTWVMIVLGFIVPMMGVFTFFIPTYVWAQEFPIEFMVSMLSALKKCSPLSIKERSLGTVQKISKVVSAIESDFNERNMSVCQKMCFPFYTPYLSILSCLYYTLFLAFFAFYLASQLDTGEYTTCSIIFETVNVTMQYPDGLKPQLGWFIYFIVSVGLLNIFNIVVVVIGFWWMCIVPIVVVAGPSFWILLSPCFYLWYVRWRRT